MSVGLWFENISTHLNLSLSVRFLKLYNLRIISKNEYQFLTPLKLKQTDKIIWSLFCKEVRIQKPIVSDRERALQNDSPLSDLLYIHQHFGLCRLTCLDMASHRECYFMLQLTFKGECTYFWLNHYCQLGPNISNSNLLQNMEASQTIKNPRCLLNGKHRVSWCYKDGKSSREKKFNSLF